MSICITYTPSFVNKESYKNIFENNEYSIYIVYATEMENKIMNDKVPYNYLEA